MKYIIIKLCSLVPETLEDYFERKATHAHGIFPPLSANTSTAFSSDYGR